MHPEWSWKKSFTIPKGQSEAVRDRIYNDQNKLQKWQNIQRPKQTAKMTNTTNDPQTTTQKTQDWETWTPQNRGIELRCYGRVSNLFSLLKVSSCTVKRDRHHVIWKYRWTPVCVKIQIIINTKSMHRLQTNESKDKPNIVFTPIA